MAAAQTKGHEDKHTGVHEKNNTSSKRKLNYEKAGSKAQKQARNIWPPNYSMLK